MPDQPEHKEYDRAARDVDIPPWVLSVGAAVWVRDPAGRISFMNEHAEELFGRRASECIGQPCYTVVRGRHENGEALCKEECQLWQTAIAGQILDPVDIQVNGADGSPSFIRLITISVNTPGHEKPSIVHCALNSEREHRLTHYLSKVATRSPHLTGQIRSGDRALTPRELEILSLLAGDQTLHAIASQLNISYTTVRNHVQHILAKLGVHSIMEAVACYILSE